MTLISGWKAIADYLSQRVGLPVSTDMAEKWSKREDNPLPVTRLGHKRPQVFAESAALDSYAHNVRR